MYPRGDPGGRGSSIRWWSGSKDFSEDGGCVGGGVLKGDGDGCWGGSRGMFGMVSAGKDFKEIFCCGGTIGRNVPD